MRVISVVEVPVVGSPGPPVDRVVTPVPRGAPADVVRIVYEPDHRPGSDFIICGSYHGNIVSVDGPATVAGIRCFSIYGFNDVVSSVKRLIADELYLYRSVAELLHGEDCHILVFVAVEGCTQHYVVNIAVDIVGDSQVINHVVAVEVEVVDPGVLVVEISLEGFESLRLLEKLHHCVEIQIVTRETQVFLRIVLCPDCRH